MPRDIDGDELMWGTWYWAQSPSALIAGAGQLKETLDLPGRVGFFINGIGYDPRGWSFAMCSPQPEELFG